MSPVFRCGHSLTAAESKSFAAPGANVRLRGRLTNGKRRPDQHLPRRSGHRIVFISSKLLRQIVTERSEEHVVQPFGLQTALAAPGDAVDVRILQAPLQAAAVYLLFRSIVNLVPEAGRPFD